jgi:hypothetical protein
VGARAGDWPMADPVLILARNGKGPREKVIGSLNHDKTRT